MERWVGKVAVVTGASAGIGAAIVQQLVEAGVKVVGFCRRPEIVEALAEKLKDSDGELYAIKVDIMQEDDIIAGFQWIKDNIGEPIHILINNAGIVRDTNLMDGDFQMWKEVIDTNVMGLCLATREAVRDMRANDVDGHIIHVNSTIGHYIFNAPNFNIYGASKFAVTALAETLRQEFNNAGSKIKITSVSPGFVSTDILSSSEHQLKELITEVPKLVPNDIADSIMFALSTPPHVLIQELTVRPILETL